jgi:hypothetical protein
MVLVMADRRESCQEGDAPTGLHPVPLKGLGMIRLTIALAVWICLVSVAPASPAPRREPRIGDSLLAQASRRSTQAVQQQAARKAAGAEVQPEYVLTQETEILLDGKPCKYEDVPATASIVKMEVAADRKTVLRVRFRSRK